MYYRRGCSPFPRRSSIFAHTLFLFGSVAPPLPSAAAPSALARVSPLLCAPPLLFRPHPRNLSCWFQKTGKSADEKRNRVGWKEPISSSRVKISRGSLERMLCVKEPAKWQNTVGGFIIIFSLYCMYNDCPHYKTPNDAHSYITPDSKDKGASILHQHLMLFG